MAAKIVWNSRDNNFIGHVMTEEEMASLCDIYQTLDPDRKTKKTHYVLQTVWRDISSKFDVLGPYYTSESGFDHKSLIAIGQETILKLNWYGFQTIAIVCDGASPNLSMVKLWTAGTKGAYGVRKSSGDGDRNQVQPWFRDSFTGRNVYFVICPSHQVYCNDNSFPSTPLKHFIA